MQPYLTLLTHPLGSLSFLLLILSIASFWVYRHIWVWGTLLTLSYLIGLYSELVTPIALIPIATLFFCHLLLSQEIKSFWRMFVVLIAAVVSLGLKFHLIRGFNNIILVDHWQLSQNSINYKWYLNYDTSMMGIFILGLYLPLLRKRSEWGTMLTITIPWTALTMLVLLGTASYFDIITFDPKLPLASPLWLIVNLFLVAIIEEAFYRGFLQREIVRGLSDRAAPALGVIVVSLLFGIAHLIFVPSFSFFLAAVLASVMYGAIYQITGSIESSIITHYLTNVGHFFFFSYPALSASS